MVVLLLETVALVELENDVDCERVWLGDLEALLDDGDALADDEPETEEVPLDVAESEPEDEALALPDLLDDPLHVALGDPDFDGDPLVDAVRERVGEVLRVVMGDGDGGIKTSKA